MMMTDPFQPPYVEDLFIAEDEVIEEEETTSSESFVLLVKTTFSLLFQIMKPLHRTDFIRMVS
jgi:hypothetical protein